MPMSTRLRASTSPFIHRVANEAMQAPDALLDQIGRAPEASRAGKRLVVVMGQLGDFGSMEKTSNR